MQSFPGLLDSKQGGVAKDMTSQQK